MSRKLNLIAPTMLVTAAAFTVGFLFPDFGDTASAAPYKPEESVWEDYPDSELDEKDRLALRPGNYRVSTALARALDNMYAVDPTWRDVVYPFAEKSKLYLTREAHQAKIKENEDALRKKGTKQKNKLRQFNLQLKTVRFFNVPDGEKGLPEEAKSHITHKWHIETFERIRKHHQGRAVLVIADMPIESLQSRKIEGADEDYEFLLLFVLKDGDWKLCFYHNGE